MLRDKKLVRVWPKVPRLAPEYIVKEIYIISTEYIF